MNTWQVSILLATTVLLQQFAYADPALISTVSIVVDTGNSLTKSSIENGDFDGARKYSKFTVDYYSQRLDALRESQFEPADDLHLLLIDIHSKVQSEGDQSATLADIDFARQYLQLDADSTQIPFIVSNLLAVADERYQTAISENDHENYVIASSLIERAFNIFSSDTSMFDDRQAGELKSFFSDLKAKIADKKDFVSVGRLITTIQRDLTGTDTIASDHGNFYDAIRQIYDESITKLKDGDYSKAEELVIAAYLDNFEYLEADIEIVDAELLRKMETNMREELRVMVREQKSPEEIEAFIADPILKDLDTAEKMVSSVKRTPNVVEASPADKELKPIGSASADQKSGVMSEIDFIRATLQTMLAQYREGNYQAAFTSARTAYLDSYENVEIPLRTIDPDFTLEVELQFAELRNLISQKADYEKIEQATISVRRSLDESERLVTGTGQLAPTIAFTSSFAVIFREGLESVLIIGAILTYLEASRNTRFKSYVYYGIVIALGATAVTWFVASYVITISGANRELIEAVAALSATAVLFYVSFWILNKIEHKKWMEFVKAKVWQASTTGGVTVFVLLSFFTVYREGFETVLFYEAMFGFAKYMELYVGLGFVVGLGVLLAVYYVTRKLGKRLPLKMLFGLTMGVGAYLSIAFLGNAIRELQVLDAIPYTSLLGTVPRLDINMAKMTGIYPTLETIVSQIVLLAVYLTAASYVLIVRPKREEKIASMRKSRKEVDEYETH